MIQVIARMRVTKYQTHVIIVALDDMDIAGNGSQIVEIVCVAHVSCADDLLDLARYQKLLELCR